MDIKDLGIDKGIIDLFDYTHNEDAAQCIKKMMLTPLPSPEAIIERQQVLKGFLQNLPVFLNYSYSRIDFREADYFVAEFDDEVHLPKGIKLKLKLYKAVYLQYRSKATQLILLYNRLHNYIKNLPTQSFPDSYKAELLLMDAYLSSFRLNYYENIIREGKLKVSHILEIYQLVSDKKPLKKDREFKIALTRFEAFLSIATGINANRLVFSIIGSKQLEIQGFYHPLLQSPVKNSLNTKSNVVLLTGPNMSGKSTLLKAVGICVYLANIGFAVPALSAAIPFYSNIDIYINLNDDLQSGYSHFMTEIINLKKVVQAADSAVPCFAVFDELFRGTNIDDALEISRSTLKGLLNFPDSLFFVSSHLHQLIAMDEIQSGKIACHYLDCNLHNDTPNLPISLKKDQAT